MEIDPKVTYAVKFVGGPRDGFATRWDDIPDPVYLDWWSAGDAESEFVPCYVRSRKLTRDGRLIYEFRWVRQDDRRPYSGKWA